MGLKYNSPVPYNSDYTYRGLMIARLMIIHAAKIADLLTHSIRIHD